MYTAPTSRISSYAHGHIAAFYKNSQERRGILANYFKEGLDKGELCIMVSPQPIEQVMDDFRSQGLYVANPLSHGALRILPMNDTYLPRGAFAADRMLHNIAAFIDDAGSQGFNGLRAAGEMQWIGEHPEFREPSEQYENSITRLGTKHGDFIGMCLYHVSENIHILQGALRSHPTFMYGGTLHMNPYTLDDMMDDPDALESHTALDVFLAKT